jgi:alkylhydroperoxidase/carboxymuconolactone decarboxylase family protein YurZ
MSWIEHPAPSTARTEAGRQILESSLERNQGRIGMTGAFFTFPELAEPMNAVFSAAHLGETQLPRRYKEMIATLVSSGNRCQY